MSVPEDRLLMSVEEYLAFEETARVRHEYLDGRIFAMTGATLRHNIIANNLHSVLRAHLKGSGCHAFTFDVKVRIDSANCFYYPDILVSCTPVDTDGVFVKTPVLIVEVLSPSTAAIDRREKLIAYKQINSLKEYVIVHQSKQQVDIFEKTARDRFSAPKGITEGTFVLNSMPNSSLSVDTQQVYADVVWGGPAESGDEADWLVREIVGELTW
jgi:Uma2 family endonuclease